MRDGFFYDLVSMLVEKNYDLNFCFPINNSKNILKSEIRLHNGYLNVEGRFFSNTEWLNQAKP